MGDMTNEAVEETVETLFGIHIVSGQDVEQRSVTFKSDPEAMNILVQGEMNDEGQQVVTVTASGPSGDLEGMQELGDILVELGEMIRSEEMAKQFQTNAKFSGE